MPCYVISRGSLSRPGGFLDAVVIATGRKDDGKAVALFTSEESANLFLRSVDWNKSDRVVQLRPGELGQWLFETIRSGVRYLAIDPEPGRNGSRLPLTVVDLQTQLEWNGQLLTSCLPGGTGGATAQDWIVTQTTSVFFGKCDECRRIAILSDEARSTECCGIPMTPLRAVG